MFEYFKALELFEGKVVLDLDKLTPDEISYLSQFKIQLNKRIQEETEKRNKELELERKRNSKSGNRNAVNDYQAIFGHMKRRLGK